MEKFSGKEITPYGERIDEDAVERFKKVVLDMHRGIPKFYYFGLLEKLIPDKEIRDYFFNQQIFIKSNEKTLEGQERYFLGINGIIIANNYKIERLAKETFQLNKTIKTLTWVIAILTAILLIITII